MNKTKTLVLAGKQTVEWFGVYQTMSVFGKPMRMLEHVCASKDEAEAAAKQLLNEKHWLLPKQVLVEPVSVTMHPWKVQY